MASLPTEQRNPAASPGIWFVLLACLVLFGLGLGYAACRIANVAPPQLAGWGILAVVAVVMGGIGMAVLNALVLQGYGQLSAEIEGLRLKAVAGQAFEAQLASRAEQQRRLRHDIRGALSPAMLMADRLLGHADPAVKRAGEIVVRSVDKAAILLADPAEASLPDGP